ncbi:MAG: oligoendopeptidase F family protein [Clostridia bacterium]|nr:oligoendopeptidase F family protein [Clostridia bacterium]
MERKDIEEIYKWNEKDIYDSSESFKADYDRANLMLRKLVNFKGKLDSEKELEKFLKLNSDLDKKLEKIIVYAQLKKSVENNVPENAEMFSLASDILIKASEALSFSSSEISQIDDARLIKLASMPEFKGNERFFKFIIKNRAHVLPEELEKIVSGAGAFANFEDTFNVLSNAEMPIEPIKTSSGKKIRLTNSNYSKFVESPNREIRQIAYNNYNDAYKKFNMTYASNYISSLQYENFLVKCYKFKSNFERISFYDEVPDALLDVMISSVHKNLNLFTKLENIKKKALKIDRMKIYDIFAQMRSDRFSKYPYKVGEEIIVNSLSVLGKDYTNIIKKAIGERWIDLYPSKNKESLCYCTSCYDVHPFVLTNYNNTLDAVSTLSHELGHAVQAYLSSKAQPYNYADTPSLTGEIASTVNEILTKKYVIDNAKTKEEKINAIDSLLIDFYAAIFKQSLYTEFELFASGEIEKGEMLTFEKLNKKYKELLKMYFGDIAGGTHGSEYEWSRLPHLYSPFYVYTYVVGFVSACFICSRLLSGDKAYTNKYIEFLKAGSSLSPTELLKIVEIDICDEKVYNMAFKLFDLFIDELKELLEED